MLWKCTQSMHSRRELLAISPVPLNDVPHGASHAEREVVRSHAVLLHPGAYLQEGSVSRPEEVRVLDPDVPQLLEHHGLHHVTVTPRSVALRKGPCIHQLRTHPRFLRNQLGPLKSTLMTTSS